MNETNISKAETLGHQIREARIRSRQSLEECGRVLNTSPENYSQLESGEREASLPELEVLAILFDLPVAYFWGKVGLDMEGFPDFKGYLALRHVMIGTTIRQFRADRQITTNELADLSGRSVKEIESYEAGKEIPYFDLVKILNSLDRNVSELIDSESGPLAQHERVLALEHGLKGLSPELKNFIANPSNGHYLEIAMRLSKLDADTLRNIAEGLLEITY